MSCSLIFAERPFALWRWSDSDRDLVRRQGGSGMLESCHGNGSVSEAASLMWKSKMRTMNLVNIAKARATS